MRGTLEVYTINIFHLLHTSYSLSARAALENSTTCRGNDEINFLFFGHGTSELPAAGFAGRP
jgi:hypothetical protein